MAVRHLRDAAGCVLDRRPERSADPKLQCSLRNRIVTRLCGDRPSDVNTRGSGLGTPVIPVTNRNDILAMLEKWARFHDEVVSIEPGIACVPSIHAYHGLLEETALRFPEIATDLPERVPDSCIDGNLAFPQAFDATHLLVMSRLAIFRLQSAEFNTRRADPG
jgi:hypothetical protein